MPADAAAIALRPVAAGDLALLRGWINDPRIAVPFLFPGPVDAAAHQAWFERQQSDPATETLLAEAGGTPVGVVTLKGIDRAQRRAEIAIFIRPDRQGEGLGRRALDAALRVAFQSFRLRKLHLHVRADNGAARALYQGAAFAEEGRFAGDWIHGGVAHDILRLALHDDAWRQRCCRGRRVAMMQPGFLPWLGFFELAASVDRMVLLDDFQVARHSHAHRNRLFLSPGRPGFVSIPIAHPGTLTADFRAIAVAPPARWWRKLEAGLTQTYGRAPFFAEAMAVIQPILADARGSLGAVNIALIRAIAARLGLTTEFVASSETPTDGLRRSARVLRLLELHDAGLYLSARGSFAYMREDGLFPNVPVDVRFQDFVPHPYPQPGGGEFTPRLSALDALFMLSPDQCRSVLFGTRRWQGWAEMADAADPAAQPDDEPSDD
ncbi:WbqC family protein [Elioraea sp.]|uniref:WbqC family protein n=1 Tax=Elioraea sp. TaxID=2185103 RepID=UPI0025C612E9|nr:WbqC family protein [Elioraea sp.]